MEKGNTVIDRPELTKTDVLADNVVDPSALNNTENSTIRLMHVLFASLFNNLYVNTYDKDGNVSGTQLVPIVCSSRSNLGVWIEEKLRDANDSAVEIGRLFPKISYEMTDIAREPSFQINPKQYILRTKITDETLQTGKFPVPVAYRFSFNMNIWANSMESSLQILDQILPYFSPEMNIKIKEMRSLNIVNDVKVVFNGISRDDNYIEGFSTNRIVNWTLTFDVFANIVPPRFNSNVIQHVIVRMQDFANHALESYILHGDPDTLDITYEKEEGGTSDPQSPIYVPPMSIRTMIQELEYQFNLVQQTVRQYTTEIDWDMIHESIDHYNEIRDEVVELLSLEDAYVLKTSVSDAVDSNSQTDVASSKAVKTAYDLANTANASALQSYAQGVQAETKANEAKSLTEANTALLNGEYLEVKQLLAGYQAELVATMDRVTNLELLHASNGNS
ncbi:MAG: tail sheath stabilizer and completion protein [Spirochaetales bacterium]|nr:tail sheath stabilizer and completion protein [Spirochaetales bacterium]